MGVLFPLQENLRPGPLPTWHVLGRRRSQLGAGFPRSGVTTGLYSGPLSLREASFSSDDGLVLGPPGLYLSVKFLSCFFFFFLQAIVCVPVNSVA